MLRTVRAFHRVAGILAAVLCFLGTTGCASLKSVPKPAAAGEGLLVISMEHESFPGDFPFYYSMSFDGAPDDQTKNPCDPMKQYAFMKGLTPGHHVITKILVRRRDTGQIAQQWKASIAFDIKEGAITILPVRLSVAWGKEKDTKDRLFFGSYNLTKDDVAAVQQDLAQWENMELWSFAP